MSVPGYTFAMWTRPIASRYVPAREVEESGRGMRSAVPRRLGGVKEGIDDSARSVAVAIPTSKSGRLPEAMTAKEGARDLPTHSNRQRGAECAAGLSSPGE